MAATAILNFEKKCGYFNTIKPFLTKHVDNIKYRLAARKTANIIVKNCIGLNVVYIGLIAHIKRQK